MGNAEQTALRVKRLNLLLDRIIKMDLKQTHRAQDLYEIEKGILNQQKPNNWNVYETNNLERRLEVDFQKFAVSVTEITGMDINTISTFTFYASVEHLKEKFKTT